METETYLTLNPALQKHSNQQLVSEPPQEKDSAEAGIGDQAASEALPLQSRWWVWEQVQRPTGGPGDYKRTASGLTDYKEATRRVSSFTTVEEFWNTFQSLPQPSDLLASKRMVREEGGTQPVDAIMIFRDGVEPMWEDPMNSVGGHIEYKVQANLMPPGQVDEYWNNLVLGMVGGTLEPAEIVTGVRLVDKLDRNLIRLELWYTDHHRNDMRDRLKQTAASIMRTKLNGAIGREPEYVDKSHKRR